MRVLCERHRELAGRPIESSGGAIATMLQQKRRVQQACKDIRDGELEEEYVRD